MPRKEPQPSELINRFEPERATNHSPPDPQRFRSLYILIFLGVALLLAGAAYVIGKQQHAEFLEHTRSELAAVVSEKSNNVSDWQEERIDDLQMLLEQEPLYRTALRLLDKKEVSRGRASDLTEALAVMVDFPRYDAMQLFAPDGTVVVEVGEARGRRFSEEALRVMDSGQPLFVDYRLGGGDARRVRFTLVFPVRTEGDEVAGVLVAHINPYINFYPLIASWPSASSSAELLLVSAADGRTVFLGRLSDTEASVGVTQSPPGLRVAPKVPDKPGFFSGTDYRGEPVIAAMRRVRFSPWSLVAKIDQAEVFAPVRELAVYLIGVLILLVFGIGTVAVAWWQKQQAEFRSYRYGTALREEALIRHFDYLTKYANDIIVLTDDRGRIVEANDRAVDVYGYGRDELLGRRWADLCRRNVTPINRSSDEPPEPGEAQLYENLHWRADGSRFPVEISARVIKVNDTVYHQAIIRDITERKAAEARILRLNHLYAVLSQTNETIIRGREKGRLLADICRIAVEYGQFQSAWIGMKDGSELRTAAYYGVPLARYLGPRRDLTLSLEAEATGIPGLILTAIREDGPQFSNDVVVEAVAEQGQESPRTGPFSGAALPLHEGGRPVGVLAVCAEEPGFFDLELLKLLDEMALDITFAFDNFQLEANRRQAEASLRESEYRYRQLFNNMNSGVAVYRYRPETGNFFFYDVNKALERIEGVSGTDIIGRPLLEVFPGAREMGVNAALDRVRKSGEAVYIEPRLYPGGDVPKWRENWIYRLPTGEVVAVYEDVTERMEALQSLRTNEERLRLVLEGSRDGFWDIDFQTGKVYFSKRFAEMFGYWRDELGDGLESWERLINPEDLPRVQTELEAHLKGEIPQYRSEHRMLTKSGEWIWVLARGVVVRRDKKGKPLRMAGTHTDITERKGFEERLRLWGKVFESSNEGIFITDAERRIALVNSAFTKITGYSPEEAIGFNPRFLSSGRHDRSFFQAMWKAIDEVGHWQGEIYDRRKSGQVFPEWLAISAVYDDQGEVVNYVAIFSDLSERKEAEARIDFLARHDLLTGLPNDRLLREWLEQGLAHAGHEGHRLAVLTVGVDHFKTINESLGHGAGDQLLRELGERLLGCVTSDDIVARGGGDEFMVALFRIKQPTDVLHFTNCVRDALSAPFRIEATDVRITTSIGVSVYPEDGHEVEVLVRNSGAALYHAKSEGRNNLQFFIPVLNARAKERLVLENNLRSAVQQDELTLYYQPQVNTATERMMGVEALLRWRHQKGILMPDEFIPVAEESGTIIAIGDWVLREACRQQRAWADEGLGLKMAINVSAVQFRRPDFPELLARILGETGADPGFIELEVTEGMLMRDVKTTIHTLERLKRMGLGLSIDDFGTGYSSLSYLSRFPIDRLKVDQSFVQAMEESQADLTITEAIIGLGKSLGLHVIAEGVETSSEFSLLRGLHCVNMQGYYFAKPMPPETLRDWQRDFTSLRQGKLH